MRVLVLVLLLYACSSCSCEQRLSRLQARCGYTLPVTIDTIIQGRDSIRVDTTFNFLTDTLVFTKDSITVKVIRDTILKKTTVYIDRPAKPESYTISIPVNHTITLTWKEWLDFTWKLMAKTAALPLILIALFIISLIRYLKK